MIAEGRERKGVALVNAECRIGMRKPKSILLIRHASRATFSKGEGRGAGHTSYRRNRPLSGASSKRLPPRGRRSDGHAGTRQTETFRAIRHFADAKCRAQQVEGFLREAPWGTPLSGALCEALALRLSSGHREKGA